MKELERENQGIFKHGADGSAIRNLDFFQKIFLLQIRLAPDFWCHTLGALKDSNGPLKPTFKSCEKTKSFGLLNDSPKSAQAYRKKRFAMNFPHRV